MAIELSAIAAALAALKAAKDVAEAMVGVQDNKKLQVKLSEFQSKLIDANTAAFAAQDERSAILERLRELEENLAAFQKWELEMQRYHAQKFDPGVMVFVLNATGANGQPIHHACPHCYANHKIRILQATDKTSSGRQTRHCLECKSELSYGAKEKELQSSR